MRNIAFVGNPNSGKTSLFNALTGAKQRVGNWSGVTVERVVAPLITPQGRAEVVDLPGIYSLAVNQSETSLDEWLTVEQLASEPFDVVVNVIDAVNLERNLYLTLQLLEQQLPLIVVLTRVDMLQCKGLSLDIKVLAEQLGCPVFLANSANKATLEPLTEALLRPVARVTYLPEDSDPILEDAINALPPQNSQWPARYAAIHALETGKIAPALAPQLHELCQDIKKHSGFEPDVLIAKLRYQFIERLMPQLRSQNYCASINFTQQQRLTYYLDKVLLDRYLGLPLFLLIMYLMFMFAINLGGAFQDFFDLSSQAIFVNGLQVGLNALALPDWLIGLCSAGIGKGINTVVTFIPVIGAMFLALAFLEDSGYMARSAFVMDRCMRAIGLPGKSFVPMIVGFGCNVPAIMGARTLEQKRDRILTTLLSPFMSCGARLAIFTLFVAAFFPEGGQNIVFLLYFIGILMAVMTGFILQKTVLQGEATPLILELPPYQMPNANKLLRQAWHRLSRFIVNAGKIVIPVSILIGGLNSVTLSGHLVNEETASQSILASLGQAVTPIFSPMGLTQENWPATVGLFTGITAKEVVIGTLNTLYAQEADFQDTGLEEVSIQQQLTAAGLSVINNLAELKGAILHPLAARAPFTELEDGVSGVMLARFDGKIGAFAYLLFVLLYFPCISATAAMVREIDKKWTLFSMAWTTGMAYGSAVIFYQLATWTRHPVASSLWVATVLLVALSAVLVMQRWGQRSSTKLLPTRIVLSSLPCTN